MRDSDILLIEPPAVSRFGNQRIFGGNGSNKSEFHKPPLDLMMISGFLRKEGFDNTLIDANSSGRSIGDVREIIRKKAPEVVFFSTSTCTIYGDLLVARAAKEINPSIVTVAIGTHVMALPEETLMESGALDIVVYSNEWEQASLNIVKNLSDLTCAKGIFFREQGGGILKTGIQPSIDDLDSFGFPAHDKLEKHLYKGPTSRRSPKTMVMGQKACISNCSFCCQPAFFGAPYLKKRSVERFLEELLWVQSLGFREVMFNDATLTADTDWATELFEGMIRNGIDLAWCCTTRADRIDADTLRLMKRAGCNTVLMGMESSDPGVLKNIRKGITAEEIRKAVSMVKKAGMATVVFGVIGFPGETRESIRRTIDFMKTLDTTYITLGIAVPAPGTDFFRYVERNGYLLTRDWSQYDPLKKPVFSYPWLSADEILRCSKYGLRQFYLRPSYMLHRLAGVRSFAELAGYFRNFIGFLERYVIPRQG